MKERMRKAAKKQSRLGKYNLQDAAGGFLWESGGFFAHGEFESTGKSHRVILRIHATALGVAKACRLGGVVLLDVRAFYQISFWVDRSGVGEVERAWRDNN